MSNSNQTQAVDALANGHWLGALDIAERVLAIALYGWLIARVMTVYLASGGAGNLIVLFSEGLIVFFILIRRGAKDVSRRPTDWLLALVATATPLLVQPVAQRAVLPPAIAAGSVMAGAELAVQLEQSPFLNLFSDERARETLRYMKRSPDERVTREIAREICQRQGIKAVLTGSISGLGSHYVIALEAMNAQTGDVIARQQVEAENKEQVISMLGQAATKFREKLGESLPSIQKFDAPITRATTSSLEALRAFSLGEQQHGKAGIGSAVGTTV
jgi:hypothetical protein